jgi:hypothetical protein
MAKDSDILKEAREAFELAAERESDNRTDALDDIRFARLEEQWPDAIRKARELDGRPCLTVNKLPAFIRQVVNDARQNRPAIKVLPQDSNADPHTADVISGLIRNIEASSDADVAYDTAVDAAVSSGFGYWRINLAYACDDSFEQDIVFERVGNQFSVYGDPYSTAADSSDWNTAFIVTRLAKDEFERKYKGAEPVDWEAEGYTGLNDPWFDDEQVMVAEYWKREEVAKEIVALSNGEVIGADELAANIDLFSAAGIEVVGKPRTVKSHKVTQYVLTGAEVLETVEWAGKYIPIVPVYGDEINVEGKRHFRSLIRSAKDPQRMFNYWRTTATELVALAPKAPFIGPKGAFETDAAKWQTANTATHAYIEYDGALPPQRQPFSGIPAGALQEALNASDDMKAIVGIYDPSLGARSNETSGVAINARQREGDVSTFHFLDNLTRAIRHGGRIILDLIQKVYTTDRIIRVLGAEGDVDSVPLGQPVPLKGPDGQPMADEQGQAIMHVYDLTAGKYDLTVSAGPSYTTRREEAANQMIEFVRAFPPAAQVMGDMLAKNLDWPGAEEIGERLKRLIPPQVTEGGDPQQAAMAQEQQAMQAQQAQQDHGLAVAKTEGDMQAKQAELALKQQQMLIDAEIRREELAIDAIRARTEAALAQHQIEQPAKLPDSANAA